MSEPVKQRTGESLGVKDFGPFLEGQVRGQLEAVMFIGPADDLEEQFGSCLGEGNVSKFINHQEMESLESRVRNETRMLGSERGYGRPVVERPYGAHSPLYAQGRLKYRGD